MIGEKSDKQIVSTETWALCKNREGMFTLTCTCMYEKMGGSCLSHVLFSS